MESARSPGARRRVPSWLLPALGYAVSIACLVWVYYGFDWREQLPKLLATDWRLIALAVLTDVCVYVIQGWRWSLVLRPIGRVSVLRSVQAVYIGLFANEVLPLRSGEVIRCYLQARWHRIPFSITISSAVIERFLDGAWLVLGFYMIARYIELPGYLEAGARVLTGILAVIAVFLVLAVMHKKHVKAAVRKRGWAEVLHHIVDGAHDMGRSPSFAVAVVVSLLYLALQVVPIWALARGYGLDLPAAAAAVVLVILRLGSIPPQAPSNVGAFQFFTVVGVELFGVARPEATGFATLLFAVVTVPLWLGGFIALLATRMRLTDIHQDAHDQMRRNGKPGDAGPLASLPPEASSD